MVWNLYFGMAGEMVRNIHGILLHSPDFLDDFSLASWGFYQLSHNFKHMLHSNYSIQPRQMKHLRLFLLLLLFSSIISGCNRTPLEEQFISAKNDLVLLRSNGGCNEISLNSSNLDLSPADKGINPEKITIFNWNTYKGHREGWMRDLQLHGGASDIILLQEVSN
ncbi:MAG: hypothetical protein ACI8PB_005200 [Desulforhopalus sp.]|jgi:hypothetical protein